MPAPQVAKFPMAALVQLKRVRVVGIRVRVPNAHAGQ